MSAGTLDSLPLLEALAVAADLERTTGRATPKAIAEATGVELSLAAYRVRALHKAGYLRERSPGHTRGAVVHRYTLTAAGARALDDGLERLEALVVALRPVPAPVR